MENNEKRAANAARSVTTAILISTFAYAFVNSLTSVLINEIIDTYTLSGAAQGLLSSMMSMGLMLALLATPLLQGRVQKTTMLLAAGILQILMLLASGMAPVFSVFVPAVVLLGMGCGWLDSYLNSCMVDVHPADSPKYLGYLHGIFGVGSLIAPVAMQRLITCVSWRTVFYITAGMMLIAMLCIVRMRRGIRLMGGMDTAAEQRLSLREIGAYLGNGRNLLLLGCGGMTAMVQTGVICWIVRYMLLAYNETALGAVCLSIFWIAATVNRFIAPRLKARPLVLVAGGAVLSAVFLAIGILSGSQVVMCVMVGMIGLSSGHFMPMMIAECAAGHRGNTTLTTSVLMFVMGIVRVVVPLLMAFLTDAVSTNAGMFVPAFAALLCALLGVLALRAGKNAAA